MFSGSYKIQRTFSELLPVNNTTYCLIRQTELTTFIHHSDFVIYLWLISGLTLDIANRASCQGCLENVSLTRFTKIPGNHIRYSFFSKSSITKYNINSSYRISQKIKAQARCLYFQEKKIIWNLHKSCQKTVYFQRGIFSMHLILSVRKIKLWTSCKISNAHAI